MGHVLRKSADVNSHFRCMNLCAMNGFIEEILQSRRFEHPEGINHCEIVPQRFHHEGRACTMKDVAKGPEKI